MSYVPGNEDPKATCVCKKLWTHSLDGASSDRQIEHLSGLYN